MLKENFNQVINNLKIKLKKIDKIINFSFFGVFIIMICTMCSYPYIINLENVLFLKLYLLHLIFLVIMMSISHALIMNKKELFSNSSFQKLFLNLEEKEVLNIINNNDIYNNIKLNRNLISLNKLKDYTISKEFLIELLESLNEENNKDSESILLIIKNVYDSKKIIKILYDEKLDEFDTRFKNYLDNNKELKENLCSDYSYLLKDLDIVELFEYKELLKVLPVAYIVEKLLKNVSLKELIDLIIKDKNDFVNTKDKLHYLNNIYPVFNFLKGNNIRKIVEFKKEVILNILKVEDVSLLENIEEEFIELIQKLEIDKDEILIIKERINKIKVDKKIKVITI